MKRIWKSIMAVLSVAILGVSLASCAESAYDIAVRNGFTGTEKEWIQSLRGADGEDAKDITAQDLYQAAVEDGFNGTYLDFCREVLNLKVQEDNDVDMIAKNMTSVVSIYCGFSRTIVGGGWWQPTQTEYYRSAGSGVVLSIDKETGNALVVTNYHVVYDSGTSTASAGDISKNIYLYPYGSLNGFSAEEGDTLGTGIQATFIGGSMDYDIALLEVRGNDILKDSILTAAELGNSNEIVVGEKVFAIGNPDAAGISVTEGMISVTSEYIEMSALDGRDENGDRYVDGVPFRVMRTDAAINGGNSGGGLFDKSGKLIGIVNAKSVGSETDNMGYSLPITQVKYVCNNILANSGKVKVATLGVMVSITESKAYYNEEGTLSIFEKFEIATAATAGASSYGKLSAGDQFKEMQINDGEWHVFTRRYELNDLLISVKKGDTVRFKVVNSNGNEETVEIVFDDDAYFTLYK